MRPGTRGKHHARPLDPFTVFRHDGRRPRIGFDSADGSPFAQRAPGLQKRNLQRFDKRTGVHVTIRRTIHDCRRSGRDKRFYIQRLRRRKPPAVQPLRFHEIVATAERFRLVPVGSHMHGPSGPESCPDSAFRFKRCRKRRPSPQAFPVEPVEFRVLEPDLCIRRQHARCRPGGPPPGAIPLEKVYGPAGAQQPPAQRKPRHAAADDEHGPVRTGCFHEIGHEKTTREKKRQLPQKTSAGGIFGKLAAWTPVCKRERSVSIKRIRVGWLNRSVML